MYRNFVCVGITDQFLENETFKFAVLEHILWRNCGP